MADKFNEYWPLVEPISLIPMLLDPRVKLDLVVGKEPKSVARNLFSDVFSRYVDFDTNTKLDKTSPATSQKQTASQTGVLKTIKKSLVPLMRRLLNNTTTAEETSCISEINNYLQEPRISSDEKDILSWWRNNQCRFPILAKMARDYLSMQPSSVPSERGFSKSGITITDLRNRLHPETVRCLMCLHSWFKIIRD
jgi:hypothetical protein